MLEIATIGILAGIILSFFVIMWIGGLLILLSIPASIVNFLRNIL